MMVMMNECGAMTMEDVCKEMTSATPEDEDNLKKSPRFDVKARRLIS